MIKIGVFDSGVGGLSVANAIKKALPQYEILLREDKGNLPYGNKTPARLLELVEPILKSMVSDGCTVIVVACNTVTTTIIAELRERITVPLIGMEPMVKPAAEMTKTGIIAVLATPSTLKSNRYAWLKTNYAKNIIVIEPDCSTWSYMVEHNQIDEGIIKRTVETALESQADVIVLGCTHYHWIETLIKLYANNEATVLQPEMPVIKQLMRVLEATH